MLGLVGEEAETFVIRGVANQKNGAVAALGGFANGGTHQRRADALALMGGIDSQRAEQQRFDSAAFAGDTGLDIPQAHRADDMAILIAGDECQTFGRNATGAQLLGRLAAAAGAHGAVQQVLTGDDIARIFLIDMKCLRCEKCPYRIQKSGHPWPPVTLPPTRGP
ncbi:hypothetical protein D3C78_546790 [compost metagenome]